MNISQMPLILIYLCRNSQHFESSLVFNSLWTHVSDQGRAQKKLTIVIFRKTKPFLRPFQNTKYEQRQKYCIYYALYHNQNLSTSRALQGLRPLHRLLNFPSDVRFPWKRIMKFKTCFLDLVTSSASRSSPLIVTSTKIQKWKQMPNTPTSPASQGLDQVPWLQLSSGPFPPVPGRSRRNPGHFRY